MWLSSKLLCCFSRLLGAQNMYAAFTAMLPVQALAATPDIRVTFVGVTRQYQQCQEGVQAQSNAASAIQYRCLAPEHFVPAVSSPSGGRTTLHQKCSPPFWACVSNRSSKDVLAVANTYCEKACNAGL